MDELFDIIELYKFKYPLWSDNSLKEIFQHIYPSLILGQYNIHQDEEGVYGFRNWAFLNGDTEEQYLKTGELDLNDWNSGDKTWVIDSIFTRKHNEHMIFYKTYVRYVL